MLKKIHLAVLKKIKSQIKAKYIDKNTTQFFQKIEYNKGKNDAFDFVLELLDEELYK